MFCIIFLQVPTWLQAIPDLQNKNMLEQVLLSNWLNDNMNLHQFITYSIQFILFKSIYSVNQSIINC